MSQEYTIVGGGYPMGWGGFAIVDHEGLATFVPARPPDGMVRSEDWAGVHATVEEAKEAVGERYGRDLRWHLIPEDVDDPIEWTRAQVGLDATGQGT